jgi:hypothetical protein
MLRYAIEKLSPEERLRWMKKCTALSFKNIK